VSGAVEAKPPARGYSDGGYAASLAEFGDPRSLPRSGGWLLERPVPDRSATDLVGPYPLFCCPSWDGLAEDIDELEHSAVSVVLVADPLAGVVERDLRRAFPDHVVPFKRHHVRELNEPVNLPTHHRRHLRRASRALEVEVCTEPLRYLDDWVGLYAGLVERHRLTGIRAFSPTAFRRQLGLPGMIAVRAVRGGESVGMALWLEDAPNAYYHLAAYSPPGYEVSASYALFQLAFDHLRELGVRRVDLGGGTSLEEDGLTRFKRGWANDERVAHLCGRILDRTAYTELTRAGESQWFPAYREPGT
jgi:GNAT acetyltransferase-like protein